MHLNRRHKDAIVVVVGVILSYSLSLVFNLAEEINIALSRFEHIQLDEIPLSLLVLSLLSVWFSNRRIKELLLETKQRKMTQEQLKRSELLYKTLFNSNQTGNCVTNLNGDILMANNAFNRICNLLPESMNVKAVFDFDWQSEMEKIELSKAVEFQKLQIKRKDNASCYTIAQFLYVSPGFKIDAQSSLAPQIHIYIVDITKQYLTELRIEQTLRENQYLARHAIQIQEKERKFVAQEIHDETGQYLTAIRMDALTLQTASRNKSLAIAERIASNTSHVQRSIHELIKQLRPISLNAQGLENAISQMVRDWNEHNQTATVSLQLVLNEAALPDDVNIIAFRIIQESLTNISKHAQASEVTVSAVIEYCGVNEQPCLLILIRDNGIGLSIDCTPKGLGLIGMRERVESIGGKFWIDSEKNTGSSINAKVPLNLNIKTEETTLSGEAA